MKGAKIGDNPIIAAGSVVLGKEYPSNVIIGGNPARIIKEIEKRVICQLLQDSVRSQIYFYA